MDLTANDWLFDHAFMGDIEGVKKALADGADVNFKKGAALQFAATQGSVDVVELLLEKGADVHAMDDLALRCAATHGKADTVRVLLENGADPLANDGEALSMATRNKHQSIVELLERAIAQMPLPEAPEDKHDRQMRATLKKRSRFAPRPDNLDRVR